MTWMLNSVCACVCVCVCAVLDASLHATQYLCVDNALHVDKRQLEYDWDDVVKSHAQGRKEGTALLRLVHLGCGPRLA